ncbi:MAG: LemA family protein [Elusimicrobia bacterium]|nr:LemA family protein [Elusimicrobiota bacterium]
MTVTVIVIALLLVVAIGIYNGLVTLKNQVDNAFKQIDIQLKRRHDLIPNLVNSVKGEMKFESETLEKVVQARAGAVNAGKSGSIGDIAANEGMLSQALGKLLAISENYPDLKAIQAVKALMEELAHTENQIGFSRQLYNDLVTKFNIKQQVFPNNLFASMLGFSPAVLFELPKDSKERENVKVEF